MKFEDSWENNTHQDVEDAIKDKVEEIEGRIDDVEESVPDAETIEAIRQAAQDAQDAAAAVGDIINENSGRVSHAKAPAVVLRYIHQNGTDDMSLDDLNAGDVYADAGGSLELIVIENGSKTVKNIGTIDKGLIFYSIREEGFFRYLGSAAWELLSQGGGEEQEGTFAELDVDSRLKHIQSPVMVLDCISQSEEPGIADCPIGGYYCYMGNQASACRIRYRKALVTAGRYEDIDLSSPQGHVLYYNKPEDKTYHWDGQRLVAVLWHAGLAIDNRLMSSRATAIVLLYISDNLVDGEIPMNPQSGDVYCDSNNHIIVRGGTVNPDKEYVTSASLPTTPDADLGLPDQKLVYYDVNKKDFYRWNGSEWKKALDIDIDTTNLVTITQLNNTLSSYATKKYVDQAVQQAEQGETVVTSVDDVVLVDGFNSNTVLAGATARSVKELYDNVMALRNALAGIAFKDSLPNWITVPQITYSMDTSGLTNFATPQTTSWVEGSEVTVVLSAAAGYVLNANVASAMTVTDMEDNALTLSQNPTFDSTSNTISFKIAHIDRNFKVTASAAQALAVTMKANSHLNLSPEGVISGETFSGTITPDNGYKLPTAINGSDVSGTHGTVTFTRTSDTEGTISIANVQSAVTINADAVPLTNYQITFPTEHIEVTDSSGTPLTSPVTISELNSGWSCRINAESGYKITSASASMDGQTIPSSKDITTGEYSIVISKVTANVTVSVRVSEVLKRTVSLVNSNTNDGDSALKMFSDEALTTPVANGVEVTEGTGFTCYLGVAVHSSPDLYKYEIVWDHTIGDTYAYPIKVMIGNTDSTASVFKQTNDTLKIRIDNVTDDVTINARTMCITLGKALASSSDSPAPFGNKKCSTDYIELPEGYSAFLFACYDTKDTFAGFYDNDKVHQGNNIEMLTSNGDTKYFTDNTTNKYLIASLVIAHSRVSAIYALVNGSWKFIFRGLFAVDYRQYDMVYGKYLTSATATASDAGAGYTGLLETNGANALIYKTTRESSSAYQGRAKIYQFNNVDSVVGTALGGKNSETRGVLDASTEKVKVSFTDLSTSYTIAEKNENGELSYWWLYRGSNAPRYIIGCSPNLHLSYTGSSGIVDITVYPVLATSSIVNYTISAATGYEIVSAPVITMGGVALDVSAGSGNTLTDNGDGTYTLNIGTLTGDVYIKVETQATE